MEKGFGREPQNSPGYYVELFSQIMRAVCEVWREINQHMAIKEVESPIYLADETKLRQVVRNPPPTFFKTKLISVVLVSAFVLMTLAMSIHSYAYKQQSVTPHYDNAHLAVTKVQLWAAVSDSEAMITVRNIGSKPVVPCAILRGAIVTGPWLNGGESEDRLFTAPEWQDGGKGQVNCDKDWNPGVEKTYSIKLDLAFHHDPDEWTSLSRGEELWYVVSRLEYRDSESGPALTPIENCVWFRAQQPEWAAGKCFGHNDPTLNSTFGPSLDGDVRR